MNCRFHKDEMSVSVCRLCGEPICQKCKDLYGDKICNDCAKLIIGKNKSGFFSKFAFMEYVKCRFNAALVAIILSVVYIISMWLPVISNKSVVPRGQGESLNLIHFISAQFSDNKLVNLFGGAQILTVSICVYVILALSIMSIFYSALLYHKKPQILNIFADLTVIPSIIIIFIFAINIAQKNKEGSIAVASNGLSIYLLILCSILTILFGYLTYFIGKKRYKKATEIFKNPVLNNAENKEIKVFYTLQTKQKTVVGSDIEEGVYAVYSADNVDEFKIDFNDKIERFYPNQQFELVEGDVLEPVLNNVQLQLIENKIIQILYENSVTHVGDVRGIYAKKYEFRSANKISEFKFAVNGEVIAADIPIEYTFTKGDVIIVLKGDIKITPLE